MKFEKLSEKEKGYLFGLFEGDGYKVYDKKSRHYHIEFYLNSVKDKMIISFIVKILRKIGLNPNLYKDKRYNCIRVRVYSKELFSIIHKDIKFNDKNRDFKIGFVSGMIDSEGYVNNKKRYIMIVNTNRKTLEKISQFLNSLGIGAKVNIQNISQKDKLPSYRMHISVTFKNTNNLSIKAGML